MSKLRHTFSYAVQWLAIIASIGLTVFYFVRPVPPPDRAPDTWRSWAGFYALSYGSVSRANSGPDVSRDLLREHFTALKNAGYNTVTPSDLTQYLDGKHALPEKPLLLMFEGGRKDTILNVTPLLREFGFVAVVCVNTGACESNDRFYLTSSELAELARQPHWYLGSMGHAALSHLPQDSDAVHGHFLTRRRVVDGHGEDDVNYVTRVMQDYATSANFLGESTGRNVVLFLYPFTDRGIGRDADPLAASTNRMAVELLYRLAFADAYEPFNGPTTDRYALTRLKVDRQLDAAGLLGRLARSQSPRPRKPGSDVTQADWLFSARAHPLAGPTMTVAIEQGGTAWIKGSQDWTDSEIGTTVQFLNGAVAGIYTRYTDPEQCLYLSVAESGIRLQERTKPDNRVTLMDHKAKLQPGRDYRVRLRVKRNRAWVFLADQPIGDALPLGSTEGRGKSGVGSNGGSSRFSAVSSGQLPPVFVLGQRYRELAPSLRESALAFLPSVPATVFHQSRSICLNREHADEMIAAASEGVEPIPVVDTTLSSSSQESDCRKLEEIDELKPLVRRLALRGIAADKPQSPGPQRLPPVRLLTAAQAREWMSSGKDTEEIIVVEGPRDDVLAAVNLLLHRIPPRRLLACSVPAADLPPGVGIAVPGSSK